jgi:hypothetical protein
VDKVAGLLRALWFALPVLITMTADAPSGLNFKPPQENLRKKIMLSQFLITMEGTQSPLLTRL